MSENKPIMASPSARKTAKDNNIDLSKIEGTGKKGYITEKDVIKFMESTNTDSNIGGVEETKEVEVPEEDPSKKKAIDMTDPAVKEAVHQMVQQAIKEYGLPEKEKAEALDTTKRLNPPAGDIMDDPAVFYNFSAYHHLGGYNDNGREVITPYNKPIKFDALSRFKKPSRSGKGEDVVSVCQAIVYSKAEADFVRNHPAFNNTVFENRNKVEEVNPVLQQQMQEVSRVIDLLDDVQVIKQCREASIEVSRDVSRMRRELKEHRAKIEMQRSKNIAAEIYKNRLMKEANKDTEKFIAGANA